MGPDLNYVLILVVAAAIALPIIIIFLARRFVRCPSNKILVIQGKVGRDRSAYCLHGGMKLVWPLIQEAAFLDLVPLTINIPLRGALSRQNIRVNVPSTFTIAISKTPEGMNNAAVSLLGLAREDIETMATEIIFGQLRLTVASLTIEEINQDREQFLAAIQNNIDPELKKIGLTLINVNITDITDESGYIESIGKKAASTAINQAKVDVAEADKRGDIGSSLAERERRVQTSTYNAEAVEGENIAAAKIADHNAILAEKKAEASRRGEVANQAAMAEIQKQRAQAEMWRLNAEQVVPREIEKKKMEIEAEAIAQKRRIEAKGEADAIMAIRNAEAEGIQKVLAAKARGYNELVTACGKSSKDAATMLVVEKLDHLVQLQTEAIKNLKIGKITVWDSGNSEKGSSTANFLSNMMRSLPPLHEVARMAGVELPEYLGAVKEAPVLHENGRDASEPVK